MKRACRFICLIFSMLMLLPGCGGGDQVQTEPSDTAAVTEPVTEPVLPVSFGGIPFADFTEIAYYDEELKEQAERIAEKMALYGAAALNVHEGAPAEGAHAIVLGGDLTDPRVSEIGKNDAVVIADGTVVFAATQNKKFGHEYAANILEAWVGKAEYEGTFSKQVTLFEIEEVEKSEEPPLLTAESDTSGVYFEGTTEYDALQYQCGEQIVFEISLMQNGENVASERLQYSVTCDDGTKMEGSTAATSGTIRIKTACTVPGFVRVVLTAIDKRRVPLENAALYEGGAGVSIEEIEQIIEEPVHYDRFWADQMAKLDEIGIEVLSMTEIPSGNENFLAYDVALNCIGPKGGKDMPSTFVLTVPKDAEPGTLSGKLVFYGYGKPHPATQQFTENGITLCVNSHGLSNYGMPDSYYDEYWTEIGDYGFDITENTDPYKCYFAGMLLRDIQAARYLLTRPEYDGKGITFEAGSMGGMRSINVAAQIGSENIKVLNLSFPWLADMGGKTVGKLHPDWIPAPIDDNGALVSGLFYFDPVNAAKRVTAPVTLFCRLGDYICPPSGQVVLYKAFASEEKTLTCRQNGTHGEESPNDKSYTVVW